MNCLIGSLDNMLFQAYQEGQEDVVNLADE